MVVAANPSHDRRSAVTLFSRLRTAKGQADPFPIYEKLRSMGGVSPAPWGGSIVTSFDLCNQVLRNRVWLEPDKQWREQRGSGTRWNAPSSREMSSTLPALNPPEHTRIRQAAGTFGRAALQRIGRTINRATEQLLCSLSEQLHSGVADFTATVSDKLPVTAIGDWLGLPVADWPQLRDLTHDTVFTQELLPSASDLARSDTAMSELRAYFMDLVRHRRVHPGQDPVSGWIRTWDAIEPDRDKADEGVYFLALFVLLAALETTSSLLSTMTLRLVEQPERWDLIAARPDLISGFVEETLRYDPPTHVISRIAAEDSVLGGVEIRKDDMVHLMVAAAHRDPAKHRDPEQFDPERKAGHLAFSGGIHYCLGAPIARLEAQTLLHQLVRRLPRLTLARRPSWASPRVAFRRLLYLDVAYA
ncbi:cytochrome P450 [Streptomyces spiralis]